MISLFYYNQCKNKGMETIDSLYSNSSYLSQHAFPLVHEKVNEENLKTPKKTTAKRSEMDSLAHAKKGLRKQ